MDSWARSQNGKLVAQKQFDLDGHPALEVKLELPAGLTWQRYYLASRRLYEVSLALKTEQRAYEDLALKVLETFKVLSDAEVTAALKTKATEAEPSPLPQEPVVSRVGSDAADDDLRDKVRTVFHEDEDLSGTWSVQRTKARCDGVLQRPRQSYEARVLRLQGKPARDYGAALSISNACLHRLFINCRGMSSELFVRGLRHPAD
jgi:hypothetical protein